MYRGAEKGRKGERARNKEEKMRDNEKGREAMKGRERVLEKEDGRKMRKGYTTERASGDREIIFFNYY